MGSDRPFRAWAGSCGQELGGEPLAKHRGPGTAEPEPRCSAGRERPSGRLQSCVQRKMEFSPGRPTRPQVPAEEALTQGLHPRPSSGRSSSR